MKKILNLFLTILIGFSLVSCSNSREDFKNEYNEIYDNIQMLYSDTNRLSEIVAEIWGGVGTKSLDNVLDYMMTMSTYDFKTFQSLSAATRNSYTEWSLAQIYGWDLRRFGDHMLTDDSEKEFYDLCIETDGLFERINNTNTELSQVMKKFREDYSEKYADEFSRLHDLYVEVSTFAEMCLKHSGDLKTFSSNANDYEIEIVKLLKSSDIY